MTNKKEIEMNLVLPKMAEDGKKIFAHINSINFVTSPDESAFTMDTILPGSKDVTQRIVAYVSNSLAKTICAKALEQFEIMEKQLGIKIPIKKESVVK